MHSYKLSDLEKNLFDAMSKWEIIDCHEHLSPEEERLKLEVDVFILFSQYTHRDLVVAGMTEEQYESLFNQTIPLDMRWETFAPYWKKIRYTSYSKEVLISVEKFYGFSDINESTYKPISKAIKKANKPGIYEEVLRKTCNIKTCLADSDRTDLGTPLLTPIIRMPFLWEPGSWKEISHPFFNQSTEINSLKDYIEVLHRYIIRIKKEGAVGLKIMSNPYKEPNFDEANSQFEELKANGKLKFFIHHNPLRDYGIDCAMKFAEEENLVVAVHTGYWGDFRNLDPLHMIPILQRYPKVRFDIYHLGYPWVRETLMLGKGFPNVWLNFCWTHIISQKFAMAGLDEAIDLIPINKILAFGGDHRKPVEEVYGHLVMARENIVKVLARRIEDGQFTETQALDMAKKWFWNNPIELYQLKM